MSDRTWNAVDARLYEEMWSSDARLIMGVLIARCPNPYGVYDIPYLILSTLFSDDRVHHGLQELASVEDAPIKLYRNNRVVWIIKKWKRAGEPNLNQQKGAYNTIYNGMREVWSDFYKFYREVLRGLNGGLMGVPSESESESDTESKKNKTKKVLTHPAKFEPKHLKCVQELAAKAQKLNKRFVSVEGKDGEKQAAELAVIDRNGDNPRYRTILQRDYCWELLEEALWWAMDDDFLGQQLQSVSGLRKTWKNGMPKWVNICVKFLDDNLKRFGQDWLSKGERRERSQEKHPHKQSGDTAILVKEVADGLRDPYPKPELDD